MSWDEKSNNFSEFSNEIKQKIRSFEKIICFPKTKTRTLGGHTEYESEIVCLNIHNEGKTVKVYFEDESLKSAFILTPADDRIKGRLLQKFDLEPDKEMDSEPFGEEHDDAVYSYDDVGTFEQVLSYTGEAYDAIGIMSKDIRVEFVLSDEEAMEFRFSLNVEVDSDYLLEMFVNKYGRGNPETREKLRKTMNEELEKYYSKQEVEKLVGQEQRQKERENLEKVLDSRNLSSREEEAELFVELFGEGNEKLIRLVSEILGRGKSNFKDLVEEKFEEKREDKELDSFKEELGISSSSTESESLEDIVQNAGADLELIKSLESDSAEWSEISDMSGFEFEEFVKELFEAKGYESEQTPKAGDQGADVIAEKPYEKIAIQAKSQQSKVSNSAVQEVKGAIEHYGCDKGLVVATSGFTNSAKELAESNDIGLLGRDRIMEEKRKYIDDSL